MITLKSFSFRDHVLPAQGANVIDCRVLRNPHRVKELKPLTGLDKEVQDYVMDDPQYMGLITKAAHLKQIHDTIFFGCYGGKHRSVAVVELVAEVFRHVGIEVETEHLSLPKVSIPYTQ